MEMTKYQLQASNKWSFDFIKETPIKSANSQFKWKPSTLNDTPRFYHHVSHQPSSTLDLSERSAKLFSECENICPLSQSISAPSMIIQNTLAVNKRKIVVGVSSTTSFAAPSACSSQRKITGEYSRYFSSLYLITPMLDLKTINSHQILIRLCLGYLSTKYKQKGKISLSRFLAWKIEEIIYFSFPDARLTQRDVYHCTKKAKCRRQWETSTSFIKCSTVGCGEGELW